MNGKAWTRAEERYLREHYIPDGAKACAIALDRSWRSVTQRAKRLKINRRPRWTFREDGQLRMMWGHHSIARIAKALCRSEDAVYSRARDLELGLGCPQGLEMLSGAAERCGYAVSQLRRILNWAGIPIDRAWSKPSSNIKAKRVHWVVEPYAVDEAVAKWHQTESVEGAAHRRGICSTALHRLLKDGIVRGDSRIPAKPRFRRHWRIPTVLIDELVAIRAQKETLGQAAARVGVTATTLRVWLREAGIEYTVLRGVPSAEVDRIVAEKRAAGCNAWRPWRGSFVRRAA